MRFFATKQICHPDRSIGFPKRSQFGVEGPAVGNQLSERLTHRFRVAQAFRPAL